MQKNKIMWTDWISCKKKAWVLKAVQYLLGDT